MPGKGILRLMSLMLLTLFVAVACRPTDSTQEPTSEMTAMDRGSELLARLVGRVATEDAPDAEELTILDVSFSGEPGQLDPQTAASSQDVTLVENLFAGLTRYDHATDSIVPELASEWEVSADGLIWTFHLRDDVFWISSPFEQSAITLGRSEVETYRPVVAADVAAAVKRLCNSSQSPDVFIYFIIDGCEAAHVVRDPASEELEVVGVRAINNTMLQFRLTQPASYFLTMTSLQALRPIPAEIVAESPGGDESWAMWDNVISSGPFVLGPESTADVRMVLKRNPLWPIPFQGNVDQVNIWWLPDDEANELWVEKSLDVSAVSAEMREEMEGNVILRSRLRLITNQRSFYMAFNFDSPVLSEDRVRRAFSAAIDREALIDEVFAGLGLAQRHFSPPGVIGAPPADIVGMGYNPDLARIEMANSSYRDCRFMPEVRYLVGTNDLDLFLAETIRAMWVEELNCQEEQIIIEQVQFGSLLANTRKDAGEARPDLWNLGWSSFYPDAHNWLFDVLHCRDSENRPDRPCSEVDSILQRASHSQDISERWDLYRNAENLFFGEGGIAPIAPLLVQGEEFLVQTWVNFVPAQFGGEQYDTYQVAAEEKKLERLQ